jgi:hypothetical protein
MNMRAEIALVVFVAAFALTACNKSSPPPQKPLTPRGVAQIEIPLRLPAP